MDARRFSPLMELKNAILSIFCDPPPHARCVLQALRGSTVDNLKGYFTFHFFFFFVAIFLVCMASNLLIVLSYDSSSDPRVSLSFKTRPSLVLLMPEASDILIGFFIFHFSAYYNSGNTDSTVFTRTNFENLHFGSNGYHYLILNNAITHYRIILKMFSRYFPTDVSFEQHSSSCFSRTWG